MKEWIKNGLKKALTWIILVILAGVIWELFRPIYTASITAIGQTGNFFVNLFYAAAALSTLTGFVTKIVSCIAGILFGSVWYKMSEQFSIIREKTEGKAKKQPENIARLLKKFKIIIGFRACFIILVMVVFFIYGMFPLTLKNVFDCKVTILQAVISQEQANKLNARWCLMRSRQDYLRLMNDIKEYESIHKTELEKLSSGE